MERCVLDKNRSRKQHWKTAVGRSDDFPLSLIFPLWMEGSISVVELVTCSELNAQIFLEFLKS